MSCIFRPEILRRRNNGTVFNMHVMRDGVGISITYSKLRKRKSEYASSGTEGHLRTLLAPSTKGATRNPTAKRYATWGSYGAAAYTEFG